jgi:hypothetical protein
MTIMESQHQLDAYCASRIKTTRAATALRHFCQFCSVN